MKSKILVVLALFTLNSFAQSRESISNVEIHDYQGEIAISYNINGRISSSSILSPFVEPSEQNQELINNIISLVKSGKSSISGSNDNLPYTFSPRPVKNKSGKNTYSVSDLYLLLVISNCNFVASDADLSKKYMSNLSREEYDSIVRNLENYSCED